MLGDKKNASFKSTVFNIMTAFLKRKGGRITKKNYRFATEFLIFTIVSYQCILPITGHSLPFNERVFKMKNRIALACVCLSIFAISAFSQTVGEAEMYYGRITAVNTGFYYRADGIFCAVQLEPVNQIPNQFIQSSAGNHWIVLVKNSNDLRKEILATLMTAYTTNTPVHLLTAYHDAHTTWNGDFNELVEASVGDPWLVWPHP